jgi:hypothetical protein
VIAFFVSTSVDIAKTAFSRSHLFVASIVALSLSLCAAERLEPVRAMLLHLKAGAGLRSWAVRVFHIVGDLERFAAFSNTFSS